MKDEAWLAVLSRVSVSKPFDLDEAVFEANSKVDSRTLGYRSSSENADVKPPSTRLWNRENTVNSYLGVRVHEAPSDCTQVAIRLAAGALERGIIPIILTTLPDSGFERFGFRVERIMGETPQERTACEEELKRFWDMAIVIDVSDVASLG
ncbi:MAG: hypothetical protein ACU0C9_05075 [Paracoccaceae bacterium]